MEIFILFFIIVVIKIVKNNFWKQNFAIVIIDNKKVIFLFTDFLFEKNLDALTAQSVAQILTFVHVLIKSSQLWKNTYFLLILSDIKALAPSNRCFLQKDFTTVVDYLWKITLLEFVHIRSYSRPHFPAFGLNTARTRITSNTNTFYAVLRT